LHGGQVFEGWRGQVFAGGDRKRFDFLPSIWLVVLVV
jgi:hypothetical protein